MAQYHIADDRDSLRECPFDPSHMIRVSRMQYHIMKCRKNHKDKNYKQCPFNAQHWIPAAEFDYHKLMTCPDRVLIEYGMGQDARGAGSYAHGDCSVPEYRDETRIDPDEEDWDAEMDNDRKAFVWNKMDANEFFREAGNKQLEKSLRLPHGPPNVLTNGFNDYNDQESVPVSNGFSQRLPKTLPKAYQSSGPVPGVGRGYGVPQKVEPSVTQNAPGSLGFKPIGQNENVEPQASVRPKGRGRGQNYRNAVTQDNKVASSYGSNSVDGVPIMTSGNSDDDARSCSSLSSTGSSLSGAAAKRNRQPRAVNAAPMQLGRPGQPQQMMSPTGYAQSQPKPQEVNNNNYSKNSWQPTTPKFQASVINGKEHVATSGSPSNTKVVTPAPSSSSVAVGLLGVGRGRGKPRQQQAPSMAAGKQQATAQAPQFIVPNVFDSSAANKQEVTESVDQSQPVVDTAADTKRQIRKLEKKLREIEVVEGKKSRGTELNDDELAKLDRKDELQSQLKELSEVGR